MARNGRKAGQQQYVCCYCRADDIWDGLDVVAELPPVVVARACQQRQGTKLHRCPYYGDCVENVARGGAVLCERVFVVDAAGGRVEL